MGFDEGIGRVGKRRGGVNVCVERLQKYLSGTSWKGQEQHMCVSTNHKESPCSTSELELL